MANVYRMFSRLDLLAVIFGSAVCCAGTCAGQTATANSEPPFKVEVRDFTAKFRTFSSKSWMAFSPSLRPIEGERKAASYSIKLGLNTLA